MNGGTKAKSSEYSDDLESISNAKNVTTLEELRLDHPRNTYVLSIFLL